MSGNQIMEFMFCIQIVRYMDSRDRYKAKAILRTVGVNQQSPFYLNNGHRHVSDIQRLFFIFSVLLKFYLFNLNCTRVFLCQCKTGFIQQRLNLVFHNFSRNAIAWCTDVTCLGLQSDILSVPTFWQTRESSRQTLCSFQDPVKLKASFKMMTNYSTGTINPGKKSTHNRIPLYRTFDYSVDLNNNPSNYETIQIILLLFR